MRRIGFIGVDIMGRSVVCNLRKAGYEVSICTRAKTKVESVTTKGAHWRDTVAEYARGQGVVITIVGYPKDVEKVYFGESGIIANAGKGAYLIGMITISPKLAVHIYEEMMKAELYTLDTPVTDGDTGVKTGTPTILAGDDREAFDACLPVLGAMGKNINYEGKAGNGQYTKMCNQIAIAGALVGACEAVVYAKKVGPNVDVIPKSISTGATGSTQMNNMASKVLVNSFESGFFLKHFVKDMSLTNEETEDMPVELTVLEDVFSMCRELEAKGMDDLGAQALIKYYN